MPSSELATQTAPSPSTTPRGPLPTFAGEPMTWAVEESMRVTVPSPWLVTHTLLAPTLTPIGSLPTPIGEPTTVAEPRSIRLTLSSPEFVTHTSCLPSEIPFGWSPTGIVPTTTGSGLLSTRRTRSSPVEAIHATCLAATTPSGALPTSSGSPSVSFVSTSMRTNVPADASVTQTWPSSETEMPSGPSPTSIEAATLGTDASAVAVAVAVPRSCGACGRRGRGRLLRVVALEDAERGERGRDQAEHEDRGQDDPEHPGALRRPAGGGASAVLGGFAPAVLPGVRLRSPRRGVLAPLRCAAGAAASASWASRANSPAVCWRSSGCLASERSTTSPSAGGRSARPRPATAAAR